MTLLSYSQEIMSSDLQPPILLLDTSFYITSQLKDEATEQVQVGGGGGIISPVIYILGVFLFFCFSLKGLNITKPKFKDNKENSAIVE